jgi:hypothetical protein
MAEWGARAVDGERAHNPKAFGDPGRCGRTDRQLSGHREVNVWEWLSLNESVHLRLLGFQYRA